MSLFNAYTHKKPLPVLAGDGVAKEGRGRGINKPPSRIVTLSDGREFHVTESQEVWQSLVDAGEVVFSENELLRMKAAMKALNSIEKDKFIDSILDLKEVFAGSYIYRGGTALGKLK